MRERRRKEKEEEEGTMGWDGWVGWILGLEGVHRAGNSMTDKMVMIWHVVIALANKLSTLYNLSAGFLFLLFWV